MADTEIVKILKVKTEGEETVANLKKEIKDLQDALLNIQKGTEDYDKVNQRLTEDLDRLAETQGKTSEQLKTAENIAKGTATTMKELNAIIKNQQDALVGLEVGSEEWIAAEKALSDNIAKRTQIMAAGKSQHAEYADSLKGLRLELKNLTQEYDSLSKADRESAEGLKLKGKINEVTNTLKSAEEGTGRFYRNVGNYTNSIVAAFGQMGGAANGLINPIKSVNNAFKLLSKNPWMAVVGVCITLIKQLVEAFKRNETAMASVQKAAAPFKAVLVQIQRAFDAIVGSVAKAAEAVGNFFGKLFGGEKYQQAVQSLQDIADKELQLGQQTRETLMKNADAENEVAELRAKAAEKNKYTAQERLGFLKQAGDKEKEIAERAYEDLKLQYEIIKQKNSLTQSSAADLQAEAEAYAAMVGAKTNYLNKVREINSQIAEASKSGASDATKYLNIQKNIIQTQIAVVEKGSNEELALKKALLKKELEISTKQAKQDIKNKKDLNTQLKALQSKYNKDVIALEQEHTNYVQEEEKKRRQIKLNGLVEGSSEYYKQMLDNYKVERDQILAVGQLQNETAADYKLRVQEATENMRQAAVAYADAAREENISGFQAMALEQKAGTEAEAAALQKIAEMRLKYIKTDEKYLNVRKESEAQYQLILKQAEREYNEAVDNHILKQQEVSEELKRIEQQRMDNLAQIAANEYGANSKEAFDARLAAAQNYYDNLEILQNESNADFKARQLAAEQEITDIQREQMEYRINNYMELANAVSSIMSDVASYYKEEIQAEVESGKISEKEGEKRFKAVKAMEIAVATINMLTGIATAISGLFTTKTGPWDIALAAAQAAAIAISGGIQIAKIKKTTLGSSGDSGGSSSVPSMDVPQPVMADYNPQATTNITGQNEMTTLANALTDNPIRAIVVESDITNAQNKRKQREAESTF